MQLSTEYRENKTSYDHKDYYVICKVQLSHEEAAVAQERGMWDHYITLGAAEAPAKSGLTTLMKILGPLLIPIGLVSSCMTKVGEISGRTDAPPWWFGIGALAIGAILWITAFVRSQDAVQRIKPQTLTISRLATNGTFQIHAPTLQYAKDLEVEIREKLTAMADGLRKSTVIPEQNTYEL
jgi:hypothetical protein